MQAYGVLDKYKISKAFFVKTDQIDCAYLEAPPEKTTEKTTEKPLKQKPQAQKPQAQKPQTQNEESGNTRSAIALENTNEVKLLAEANALAEKAPSTADIPQIIIEPVKPLAVETVPERILKIAEAIKEESGDSGDKMIIVEVKEEEKAVESAKEEKKSEQAKEIEKTA